jgi:hypothetical protein
MTLGASPMGETTGADVRLEKVPLKYSGLDPWEIWLSESQERMVLAVPPEKWAELKKLFDDVVEIAKESNILRHGNRISIDIKPNNLYWNGNDWSLYELTRTPKDNLYFLQGGFDAYLNLVDGFVSGLN